MKTWKDLLYEETRKDYYRKLILRIREERAAGSQIYPKESDVFNAFKFTPLHKVQVVIIGQDPYHGPGQAHGLSFSVSKNKLIPPSLHNIFQEMITDKVVSKDFKPSGDLTGWAEQGVLLLNSILTVRRGAPLSHSNYGWEIFTARVIKAIDKHLGRECVYLLWGSKARMKGSLISTGRILTAGHPSPYSAHSFFGCKHFSKTNEYLLRNGRPGIDWSNL